MPIDQNQLTIEKLVQFPNVLQTQIDQCKQALHRQTPHYADTFDRYLNLKLLQLFQQIDQLDNVIVHNILMYTQQVYDSKIALKHPINIAFLQALKNLTTQFFQTIPTINKVLNQPAEILGNCFDFPINLLFDLNDAELDVLKLNDHNLNELRNLVQHPEIYCDNWMLTGFFKQLKILRHLQSYLKRHLYHQWQQTIIDHQPSPWQTYFKQQLSCHALHQVAFTHADINRYWHVMTLIERSGIYQSGTFETNWS